MKKQMLSLFLALALTGCAAPGPGSTSAPAESGAAPAGSEAPASASQEESGYDRREAIERPEIGAEVVIDPPYDFDPAEMVPGDFGDYFTDCDHPTQVSTYKLAEGTDIENEVTVLQGEEEGPTIYIVAGVHGDEIAGWMTGNLVKKIGIRAGTVHILSPANRWGAEADPRVRYVTEQEDLNRSFPGDPEGNMAQRVADSIYQPERNERHVPGDADGHGVRRAVLRAIQLLWTRPHREHQQYGDHPAGHPHHHSGDLPGL